MVHEPLFGKICCMLEVIVMLKNYLFYIYIIPVESGYKFIIKDLSIELTIKTSINTAKVSNPTGSKASLYHYVSTTMLDCGPNMPCTQWLVQLLLVPLPPI